jgi:hypothetical protein
MISNITSRKILDVTHLKEIQENSQFRWFKYVQRMENERIYYIYPNIK